VIEGNVAPHVVSRSVLSDRPRAPVPPELENASLAAAADCSVVAPARSAPAVRKQPDVDEKCHDDTEFHPVSGQHAPTTQTAT
jgi:hypothetical protein